MSEPVIEVRHLSKSFGTHVVLRDVDTGDGFNCTYSEAELWSTPMLFCVTWTLPSTRAT